MLSPSLKKKAPRDWRCVSDDPVMSGITKNSPALVSLDPWYDPWLFRTVEKKLSFWLTSPAYVTSA